MLSDFFLTTETASSHTWNLFVLFW